VATTFIFRNTYVISNQRNKLIEFY